MCACLEDLGLYSTLPDFIIYDKSEKAHDYDLKILRKVNTLCISVKTQNMYSAELYGDSWLFEKNYIDKLDENSEHYLALCTKVGYSEINIKCLMPFDLLLGLDAFKEPKKKSLDTKYAIYWDDIKDIIAHDTKFGLIHRISGGLDEIFSLRHRNRRT